MIEGSFLPPGSRHALNAAWFAFVFLALTTTGILDGKTPAGAPVQSFAPRYFFTIDLDPRYQIVGTGALTEDAAAGANCYCFTYDINGRLQRIEYRRAGVLTPDPFYQVSIIDFEYHTGIERRWYRDAQGLPANNVDGIQGEELSLNAAGYPTDVTNLDESGGRMHDSSGVLHYVRTLDDQGRLIQGGRIGLLGTAITDDNGFFETRTAYDNQGRRIEYANLDATGIPLDNNDGVALIRTTYTLYPSSTQVIESYFDASGQATVEKKSGVHQCQRTLDNRGLLLSESYFDVTGAPTVDDQDGIHERRSVYDDRGNLLSEAYFDADSKPQNKASGYARIVYKYDDKNRVGDIAYFGDDGSPQVVRSVGAAVVRQTYDAMGSIVRQQFFDGKGHPSPNVSFGAPAIRINRQGDATIISLRNADDRPMQNPVSGYAVITYKTGWDHPLSPTNQYFDRHGRPMSRLRVFIINPHLHALRTEPVMQISARYGAGAAGLGALLACFLALRKSYSTKRRKVYVPTPLDRFLGWFSIFAVLEGTLRFTMTIYWAWVGYQNGRIGYGVYILEGIFIIYFLHRLYRLRVTMRVLNIERDEIHRLIREFFTKARLDFQWDEALRSYVTDPLNVRVTYSRHKCHAYLSFQTAGRADLEGRDLAKGLAQYIRARAGKIQSPPRTRIIALYYPSVALCYFLLSCTAFYTLWQLIKRY